MLSDLIVERVLLDAEASVTDEVVDRYLAKHGNVRIEETCVVRH